MADLLPRNLWSFQNNMLPSMFDDIDDLLSLSQNSTSAISISEDEKNIYVEAAIPGVNPDDVEVTIDRGVLWIRGEARDEQRDKKRKFYRRAASEFSYRIAVPGDIDPNAKVQADIDNGMIMLTFSKAKSAMPQKITVRREKNNGRGKEEKNGDR